MHILSTVYMQYVLKSLQHQKKKKNAYEGAIQSHLARNQPADKY